MEQSGKSKFVVHQLPVFVFCQIHDLFRAHVSATSLPVLATLNKAPRGSPLAKRVGQNIFCGWILILPVNVSLANGFSFCLWVIKTTCFSNDIQMTSEWCPNHVPIMSKWCANYVQVVSKWCTNDAQVMSEPCPNHVRMMPKWCPNDICCVLCVAYLCILCIVYCILNIVYSILSIVYSILLYVVYCI